MIIRGNTIGTPLKPEKTLVKSTNMTPEEQAQARANIGAASAEVIGDINAALDAIIAIQKKLMGEIITFYVLGVEYTAEAGMTWGEWVDSKYNTNGFWSDGEDVCTSSMSTFFDPDGNVVTADMVIIADAHYEY